MRELSDKQQRILSFIREFVEQHDYPPSIRDIQVGCSISSTSVVDYNLRALERAELIRRGKDISRAIRLVEAEPETPRRMQLGIVEVPLLGAIAAGSPIAVTPDDLQSADTITVPEILTGGRPEVFALRVKGTSMIDALISDGDIVLMERVDSVRDGEMVAVWLKREEETTFKRFFREGERVRLQPMNVTMEPIYTDAANVEVQGRFISALRLPA